MVKRLEAKPLVIKTLRGNYISGTPENLYVGDNIRYAIHFNSDEEILEFTVANKERLGDFGFEIKELREFEIFTT